MAAPSKASTYIHTRLIVIAAAADSAIQKGNTTQRVRAVARLVKLRDLALECLADWPTSDQPTLPLEIEKV